MTLSPAEQLLGSLPDAEQPLGTLTPAEQPLGTLTPAEQPLGTLASPEQQLDKLRDAMVQAHLALHEGVAVDLCGLDTAVYQAMEAAKAAPQAERPSLIAAMAALIDELDRVALAIQQQYLGSQQQRAAAAYREPRRVAAG